jgi:hypothetical protein
MAKPIYTWKRNLKPQVILNQLAKMTTVDPSGKVSFEGWDYKKIIFALENMVDIKNASRDLDLPSLISASITSSARKELDKKVVLDELNSLARQQLATKIKSYRLLTSLSISESFPLKRLNVGKSEIRFVSDFPKKYLKSRERTLQDAESRVCLKKSDELYSKVVIYCKSKSPFGAIKQALEDLDLFRGILCLFNNPQSELVGDSYNPINTIRLGEIHTLHDNIGKVALDEVFWFEPNFVPSNITDVRNPKTVIKNLHFILHTIDKHADRNLLIEAVVRYVRALDERDQNTAIIKLWATLETILTKGQSNCDLIPQRVSFLFKDYSYHAQLLEHIREYRNANIHSGLDNENAKNYAYQLQEYFFKLIIFYIKTTHEFSDVEEANRFLDSPKNEDTIRNQIKNLEIALNMLGKDKNN